MNIFNIPRCLWKAPIGRYLSANRDLHRVLIKSPKNLFLMICEAGKEEETHSVLLNKDGEEKTRRDNCSRCTGKEGKAEGTIEQSRGQGHVMIARIFNEREKEVRWWMKGIPASRCLFNCTVPSFMCVWTSPDAHTCVRVDINSHTLSSPLSLHTLIVPLLLSFSPPPSPQPLHSSPHLPISPLAHLPPTPPLLCLLVASLSLPSPSLYLPLFHLLILRSVFSPSQSLSRSQKRTPSRSPSPPLPPHSYISLFTLSFHLGLPHHPSPSSPPLLFSLSVVTAACLMVQLLLSRSTVRRPGEQQPRPNASQLLALSRLTAS